MDILSLILTLRPQAQLSSEKPFIHWWGKAAHALLMNVVAQADPALANSLHTGTGPRPFTVSTLHGHFPNKSLNLEADYTLRLTALTTEVATILHNAATSGALMPGALVELDYILFKVERCATQTADHPLADQANYQDMAGQAFFNPILPPHELTFEFSSPVFFSTPNRNGTKSGEARSSELPYPAAEYVIGSLLERWNAFAPMAFPVDVRRYAAESLVVRRFSLRSRTISVAGGVHTGAMGHITFKSLHYDRYWMSILHVLARYAFYAGVGAKTTMGLGQCRRLALSNAKADVPLPV